jgi:dTDP-L-rhamnose 4-epimerase
VRISGDYRLGDIRHNVADTTRVRDALGFSPSVLFKDGVERFAEWALTQSVEGGAYLQSLEEMAGRKLLKSSAIDRGAAE